MVKSDNIFYVYTLLIYILQEGTSKRIDCTIREPAMVDSELSDNAIESEYLNSLITFCT